MEEDGARITMDETIAAQVGEKAISNEIIQPGEARRREDALGQNDPIVAPEDNLLCSSVDSTTAVADEDVIQVQTQKDEKRIKEEQAPQVKVGTSADTTPSTHPLLRELECADIRWYLLHLTGGLKSLRGKDSIVVEIKYRINEGIDLDPQGKAIHDEHLADLNIKSKLSEQTRLVTVLSGYYAINADNTRLEPIYGGTGASKVEKRVWRSHDEKRNTMELVDWEISRKIDRHLDTIPESANPIPFPLTFKEDGDTIKWLSVDHVEFRRKGCKPLYLIRGIPMEEIPRDVKIQRGVWFAYDTFEPINPEIANRIENHLEKFEPTTEKSVPEPLICADYIVFWKSVDDVELRKPGAKPVSLLRGHPKKADWKDGYSEVKHVIFLVHGIQHNNDEHSILVKAKELSQGVDAQIKKTNADDTRQIMILPIHWRTLLKIPDGHECTSSTSDSWIKYLVMSPFNILREDLVLYDCVECGPKIRDIVIGQLNALHQLFRENNPKFDGPISLLGHSLGSVIFYDIVANNTGILDDEKNELDFIVALLFIIGSPLATYLKWEGQSAIESFWQVSQSLRVYNVYHPNDARFVAAMLEPLIEQYRKAAAMSKDDLVIDYKLPRITLFDGLSHSIYFTHPDFHLFLVNNTIQNEKYLEDQRLLDADEEQVQVCPKLSGLTNGQCLANPTYKLAIPSAENAPTIPKNNASDIEELVQKLVLTVLEDESEVTSSQAEF